MRVHLIVVTYWFRGFLTAGGNFVPPSYPLHPDRELIRLSHAGVSIPTELATFFLVPFFRLIDAVDVSS
ncbi:MAG: hypothetical protein QNJ54_35555 [Prochloraceae cyanobacterium]|nr:hypothetical protein [Prochloraceae cyanobacterium]